MAFRFSLAAVLRLRATLEQVEERKLLGLRHDAQRCEQAIEQTIAARRRQRLRQFSAQAGTDLADAVLGDTGFTGAGLQFSEFCLARLELDELLLRQQLAAKQEEIRRQIECFTQARRQREAVESLRDRQLGSYRDEERRREQRNLDDLFLLQLLFVEQNRPRG